MSNSTILLRSHTEGMKTACIVTLTNTHYGYCGHVRLLFDKINEIKGTPGYLVLCTSTTFHQYVIWDEFPPTNRRVS